jgi:hypothetical protein
MGNTQKVGVFPNQLEASMEAQGNIKQETAKMRSPRMDEFNIIAAHGQSSLSLFSDCARKRLLGVRTLLPVRMRSEKPGGGRRDL